jgi:transposase
VSAEYEQPDFARVARSMKANRHFTLLQAWRAYAAASTPLRRYGYAQYCHLFGEFAVRNDLVAVLHHEPGRAMLAGWAGDTIALVDAVTGEVSRAYLFLAVLPFPGGEGRRRKLHALVFTACFSRLMFVYLTFSMTLEEVIAGCADAWAFFGGVFAVVIPDNMSPVVARADAVNPRLTREWLEYAQARGFVTDPARVRHPRDYPEDSVIPSLAC